MGEVRAISYAAINVGKRIKASKKKFSWVLMVNNQELVIDLYVSKLSRKLKVVVNNEIKQTGKRTKGALFQFTYDFEGRQINLMQQGKGFDLRVDSVSFDYLHMKEKTKEEFKYEFKPHDEDEDEKRSESSDSSPLPEPVKGNNPFDDMFDEPQPVKVQVESQPRKMKPFSIKPPPPVSQPKPFGIFQAPEIHATKTTLSSDLFETPSTTAKPQFVMPDFPQVENPFLTGNLPSQVKPSNQFYTGNANYH